MKGFSPSYVTKLGHQGRLVLSEDRKLVDVDATEALLARTASVERTGVAEHHARERMRRAPADLAPPAVEMPPAAEAPSPTSFRGSDDDTYRTFNRARADKEQALAATAQMELRRRMGELGEVAVFRGVVERIGSMVSRRLEQIPARLVPLIRGAADPATAEDLLAHEFRQLLGELAAEARAAVPEPLPA